MSKKIEIHDADAMCDGKPKMTRGEASKSERNHKRRGKGHVAAFRCKICGFYHMGGQLEMRKQRLARSGAVR